MNTYEKLPHERNLGDLIYEIRSEVSNFISTRIDIFRSEFQETLTGWKQFVPLSIVAALLLGSAYVLFTLALVAVVAVAFWNNPYHWFFAFLIVGFVWAVSGALVAYFAALTYRNRAMFPRKSLGVLQADKRWLQTEARGHV
jgi:Putative Actinobacterial Holin-X, holin superfamily III